MSLQAADIVNQGYRAAGLAKRISEFYEGSEAAKIATEIYGQARDELMRAKDWSFSRKVTALTLLKGPPPAGGYSVTYPWNTTYPYPGFLYEYAYPSDCLDLRAIIPVPNGMPDLDPLPALWRIDNDPLPNVSGGAASGPPAKIILCNITSAFGVYRARITDPTLWEPGFVAALVASLGSKFSAAFNKPTQDEQLDAQKAAVTTQAASEVRG